MNKLERSPVYWAGWSLAYFQWLTSKSFDEILERIPLSTWIDYYHPYHEMELSHLIDDLLLKFQAMETKLQTRRHQLGLTQAELAKKSGVHLRNIQMYEQRNNDINKAQAGTLHSLAKTLQCQIEDILDSQFNPKQ